MADATEQQTQAAPVVIPTEESASSVSVGYTESDPIGPQAGDTAKEGELLAGEFKTQEELAAAYTELKKRLEAGEETPKEEAAPDKDKDDDPDAPKVTAIDIPEEAAAEFKEKGLDIKPFQREFERSGGLSEESYGKLEQAGYPREVVDDFIRGQRVMVESQVKAVKDAVGGEREYGKIAQWAVTSLSVEEQNAFDRVMNTADPDLIMFAVQGLKARYDSANGSDPEVTVSGAAGSGNDGKARFRSMDEVTRAMSDPRYQTDPAYRQDVEQKFLRSNI